MRNFLGLIKPQTLTAIPEHFYRFFFPVRWIRVLALSAFLCLFLMASQRSENQIAFSFQDYMPIGGVDKSYNVIYNTEHLQSFFDKLVRLRINTAKKVKVFHFSDKSYSSELPLYLGDRLQASFGAAGQGFMVPDQEIASEDWTFRSVSEGSRVGLGGFSMISNKRAQSIRIKNDASGQRQNTSFDKITILHHNAHGAVDFALDVPTEDGILRPEWLGEMSTTFLLDDATPLATLQAKVKTQNRGFNIDGILLEKDAKGIVYNNIATEQTSFKALNAARYLPRQLGEQFPDLIVLSLGYEEAQRASLDQEAFQQSVEAMLSTFEQYCPGANVLIEIPFVPMAQQLAFPSIRTVRKTLQKIANAHDVPFWDVAPCLGSHTVSKDKLEDTKQTLLYQALIQEFNSAIRLLP